MSSSVNEDQEQRKSTSIDDPKAMTIDFLRARLLSERSVSKTARRRVEELANRVEELEAQLKFVTLQRKKAEMATADVLAILVDHGISDVSEGFDSSSDHEETLCEFNSNNDTAMGNEASINIKIRRNDMQAYTSSEIDSSSSTGRSLSWKSGKDLQYSLERKKHTDLARRRASFASMGSSMRRVGKSCRRIRHRETRSATEESQNDVHVKATYCSDIEPDTSRKSPGYDKEKNQLQNQPLVLENHRQETNSHYFGGHGGDNMERALQHQAQLIGQYEEEEKAQREWEEKFRETNSHTPDSYDLGNSDVTQEQDEIKAPGPLYTAGAISSGNHHSDVTEEQDEIKAPEPPYTAGATSSGNDYSDATEEQDEIKAPELPCTVGATSLGNRHLDVTEEQDEIKAPEPPCIAGATSSGNHHSDVTEEQDEIKAPEPPYTTGATSSGNDYSDSTEEQDEIKAPELPCTVGATSLGNHHLDMTEEQDEIKAPEPPCIAGATSLGNHHSDVTEEQDEIKAPEPPCIAGATSSGNHHSDVNEEQDEIKAPEPPCIVGATSSGNHHSDVTEEQYEIKALEPPYTAEATSSVNQEMKSEPVEAYFDGEPQTSKIFPSIPDSNKGNLPDQRCSGVITFESSAPEFSHPVSMGSSGQQFPGKHHDAPLHSPHQSFPSCTSSYPSAKISLSHAGNSIPINVSTGSPSSRDLAVMPQGTITDLDSVLAKLQQAKLSLKQNLNNLPLVPGGTSVDVIRSSNPETNTVDKFKIPVAYPGLSRLPTDNEFEAINTGTQLGFTKISSEGAGESFFSNPFVESRSAFVGDQFLSVSRSPFTESRPGVSLQGPLSQPGFAAGPPPSDGLNYRNPHMNMVLPSSSDDFSPFLPDYTLRLPSREGISRTFQSSELGVPPIIRFSLYDDRYRPNMYR